MWGDEENYEVIIIQDGYSAPHQGKVKMESSITFIKGPLNIIVDTGNPSDRDHVIEALETNKSQCTISSAASPPMVILII